MTQNTKTPWEVSAARTHDGNAMIVGDEGRAFGLIAECVVDEDAAFIVKAVNSHDALVAALERIERWFGEFPETGKTWDDGSPMSYAVCFGSNGERDFMREIARTALAQVEGETR